MASIDMFKKMLEELEDKELLGMMKEVEDSSPDYLTEKESFGLLDSLLHVHEVQAQ